MPNPYPPSSVSSINRVLQILPKPRTAVAMYLWATADPFVSLDTLRPGEVSRTLRLSLLSGGFGLLRSLPTVRYGR